MCIRFFLNEVVVGAWGLSLWLSYYFLKFLKMSDEKKLKKEIKEGKIKNVLITRSDQIGDAVINIRFVQFLKKYFKNIDLLVSKKNKFIFEDECKLNLIEREEPFFKPKNFFDLFFYYTLHIFKIFSKKKIENPKYDLIIDLQGDFTVQFTYPTKYIVGPNKGFFSLFYTTFSRHSYSYSNKHLIESEKDLIKECLGLDLVFPHYFDWPPKNFKKQKKKQIFIFVGNKPERNISFEKWRNIIIRAALFAPVIVADDPSQLIMQKLKKEKVILTNRNISLISKPMSLKDLAKIVNDSQLFIALDGGGQHYLERYTNSITIYTSGLPVEWRPYSSNPYKRFILPNNYVIEETITSAGLKKFTYYRYVYRKPDYGFITDFYRKNIEFSNDFYNLFRKFKW